jgi:hypothetical protein
MPAYIELALPAAKQSGLQNVMYVPLPYCMKITVF